MGIPAIVRRAVPLLLLALAAPGCGGARTTVLLQIDGAPGVQPAALTITITLAAGTEMQRPLATGAAAALPASAILIVPDVAEAVAVSIDGSDVAGAMLHADGRVDSVPHQQVVLPLHLGETPPGLDAAIADAPAPRDAFSMVDVALPPCQNGIRDGNETDVDCGGGTCPACGPDKVCATSGDCTTSLCTAQRCTLASGPPFWNTVAPLPSGRNGVAGTALSDGRVLIAGGYYGAYLNEARTYSSASDAWAPAANMPTAREYLALVNGLDAHAYAIGGHDAAGPLALVEVYDPKMNLWSAGKPLATARRSLAGALGADGLIYAVGGEAGTPLATVEAYDTTVGAWSSAPPLPTARSGLAVAAGSDGRLYAIGGQNPAALATVEAYSPAQMKWTAAAAMPTPRYFLGAAGAPDGRIYAVAGADNAGNNLPIVEAYSPATDRWAAMPPLAVGRSSIALAGADDGRLLAVSGGDSGGWTATVEAYGPRVKLSPALGKVGDTVLASGNNFAATAPVELRFDGTPVGSGMTDQSGSLTGSIQFAVPAAQPGPHTVTLVDSHSLYPVTQLFTVSP
jgi:hypothetical protein